MQFTDLKAQYAAIKTSIDARIQRVLDHGQYIMGPEVAEMEGMDRAYLSRMVNLTTLAPDIVAAILDESLPDHVTLFDLASGTPLLWDEQRKIVSK